MHWRLAPDSYDIDKCIVAFWAYDDTHSSGRNVGRLRFRQSSPTNPIMENGTNGSSWDVARDLPFLIASDTDLQTELTQLCDVISESTTTVEDAASTKRRRGPSTAPSGARNQHQTRVRREILDLRHQVDKLVEELEETKEKSQTYSLASPWQTMAKLQETYATKAWRENRRLRDAVDEQRSFIDKMATLMRKKPRRDDDNFVNEAAWRDLKLAAHQSIREAGIHAIADRQYRQKDIVLMDAGLVGLQESYFRAAAVHPPTNPAAVVLEIVNHVKMAAPCAVIGQAAWQVFCGDTPPKLGVRATVTIERLDASTLYERFTDTSVDGLTSHANTVRKVYVEEDDGTHVIVWRSVLEDALVPHMAKGAVEDESGWIVVTPVDDRSCWRSFIMHMRIDPSTFPSGSASLGTTDNDAIQAIAASFNSLAIESEKQAAVNRGVPDTKDRTVLKVDLPLYTSLFERGHQFEVAFKSAMTRAVQTFQEHSRPSLT
ncbi:Aste57867_16775 [Aphanomyces stellatus]|uniref:Aste57867_16775 protein n=1 Tax=Aphanomyces stellatus TaxID=120398 RepID=A0A485L705_9STRA|nr:hypothetical protein As57867_016718 [Aphanomyces stellatus]VFT93540.1 Aste57867_16775 [Aphanomyces stellatus]